MCGSSKTFWVNVGDCFQNKKFIVFLGLLFLGRKALLFHLLAVYLWVWLLVHLVVWGPTLSVLWLLRLPQTLCFRLLWIPQSLRRDLLWMSPCLQLLRMPHSLQLWMPHSLQLLWVPHLNLQLRIHCLHQVLLGARMELQLAHFWPWNRPWWFVGTNWMQISGQKPKMKMRRMRRRRREHPRAENPKQKPSREPRQRPRPRPKPNHRLRPKPRPRAKQKHPKQRKRSPRFPKVPRRRQPRQRAHHPRKIPRVEAPSTRMRRRVRRRVAKMDMDKGGKGAKSWARRYPPTDPAKLVKFQAIKDTFEGQIAPHLKAQSSFQDKFGEVFKPHPWFNVPMSYWFLIFLQLCSNCQPWLLHVIPKKLCC